MSAALRDYFRCPEQLAELAPADELSSVEGFFTFRGTTAFGRTSGVLPSQGLDGAPDVSGLATCRDGRPSLPFDLSEAVSNLRLERYQQRLAARGRRWSSSPMARSLYYRLRPHLSVSVRKHLQRIRLAGWERILFPRWPVDTSVDSLMRSAVAEVIRGRGLAEVPFIWFWPRGASSCAMMTHDVEAPAGRDYCGAVMDLDERYDLVSAFQVVPEARYDGVDQLVRAIQARGFEVNVHDLTHDGNLFHSQPEFLGRARRINDYGRRFGSRGFRAGVMYRNQSWFDALDFAYDMSVPNVANLEPQRGGCCTVMPYFVGEVLELPLTTTQDYSLFHILGDYSTAVWREQIQQIGSQNGLMSFITHPDYLVEDRARSVYEELLAHLSRERTERQLWIATPSDVDRWWRDRRAMNLVPDGESWRIEGPSSERAQIAYARLQGDACIYTLSGRPREITLPA